MNPPIIHVLNYAQLSTSEWPNLMPIYHLDHSKIAVPDNFVGWSMEKLIPVYRQWLKEHIAAGTSAVIVGLENIYDQATHGGVVIATLASCVPFYTHAHVVRETILSLAQDPS